MARYEHLPIYKKAMDLTVYLEKIVRNFSRYHKYTLGSELRAKSREIVGVVIAANSRVEKLALSAAPSKKSASVEFDTTMTEPSRLARIEETSACCGG
jgi:hypothetical protein